jgi:hypothetical protein
MARHSVVQSVWRLTTGLTVRGSKPGGNEIFASVQTDPYTQQASSTMGIGSASRGLIGGNVTLTTHPHPAPTMAGYAETFPSATVVSETSR